MDAFYGGMLIVNAVCSLTIITADLPAPRVPTHGKYQPVKLRDRVSCLRIKYYDPAAAWRMNQYVLLHLWFSSITSWSPITLFCVRLILSRLLLDLILNLRGFLTWLNLCSFGINVKFNAGFLLPADDRAVHLNFGGGGGVTEDKAGDSDRSQIHARPFFPY